MCACVYKYKYFTLKRRILIDDVFVVSPENHKEKGAKKNIGATYKYTRGSAYIQGEGDILSGEKRNNISCYLTNRVKL